MTDRQGTRSAVLLDRLSAKRESLVGQLATQVGALLRRTLVGQLAPPDFEQQAARVERAALSGFSRLISAAYRRVLEESGTTGQPIDLPSVEQVVDWGEVHDEAASRIADGEQVEAVVADLAEAVSVEVDQHIEAMQESVRGKVYGRAKATGWRRVVHPELSKGGACGLCIVASTRIYHTPHLKKIHDGCYCDVLPITAAGDPGDSLNRLELGDLYTAAADSTDRASLKRVRVNDVGQIVAKRNPRPMEADDKTTARQVRNRSGMDDPKWIRQQLLITEKLGASKWRTGQLKRLRRRLAELEAAA